MLTAVIELDASPVVSFLCTENRVRLLGVRGAMVGECTAVCRVCVDSVSMLTEVSELNASLPVISLFTVVKEATHYGMIFRCRWTTDPFDDKNEKQHL